MIEPPEEAPPESLQHESTAKSSNNSHTDHQEDHWQNPDKDESDNQTDHRTANEAEEAVSSQAEPNVVVQANREVSDLNVHRTSDQNDLGASSHDNVADHRAADRVDQRMSEQTDSKSSLQDDHVESQQTDSQMPILPEQGTSSGHIEHTLSSQAERRASGPTNSKLSISSEGGASEQIDYRMSGQADQRTSEHIDSRFFSLVEQKTYEHINLRSSDQVGYKTFVKTHHKVHDQVTELAEYQAADQTDSTADYLTVHKPDYSGSDQVDHLMNKKDVDTENNQFVYGESDQHEDRIFTSKEDRDADFRVQPCKFEVSQTDPSNSKVSITSGTKNGNFLQALNSFDTRFIRNFQAKDQSFSPRFPSISTKLDYIIGQEKIQVIESESDISEYQERKSSHAHNETYRRRFPSIVYQDPYQISLQYMEKHHILQIFQVQEMIKNRDKRATYRK